MQTEIDRLLEGILKTQRTLGEEHFLLSPKVLSDFLKNEHAVLGAGADGFRENLGADKAGRASASNGVGSLMPKPSALSGVPHSVLSNDREKTEVNANPQGGNANRFPSAEQALASPFTSSVANGFPNTEAVNSSKAQGSASSVTTPTVSDEVPHTKPMGCSAVHIASVFSSVSSNSSQSASEVTEAQTLDNVGMPPVVTLPSGTKAEQWQWLKEKVLSCPNCLQHVPEGRKPVFGSGNLDADIFFCGEAPGAEEEEQGEVFVGRAGQLLTKIIEAMGLRRSEVYIGNIMNWRPETPNRIGNRPPTQEEMRFCLPYLIGQVEIVRPKVLVALGLTAVNGLLGYDSNRKMRDCRGHWFEFHKIPLLVTYHPSYLLRNGTSASKRMVWEDMLCVMKFLGMPISEKQEGYFL